MRLNCSVGSLTHKIKRFLIKMFIKRFHKGSLRGFTKPSLESKTSFKKTEKHFQAKIASKGL